MMESGVWKMHKKIAISFFLTIMILVMTISSSVTSVSAADNLTVKFSALASGTCYVASPIGSPVPFGVEGQGSVRIGGKAIAYVPNPINWQSGYPGFEPFPRPTLEYYGANLGDIDGSGLLFVSWGIDDIKYSLNLKLMFQDTDGLFWPQTNSFQVGSQFKPHWLSCEGIYSTGLTRQEVTGKACLSAYIWEPGKLPAGSYYGEPNFQGSPEGLSYISVIIQLESNLLILVWTNKTVDLHYNVHPFFLSVVLPASTIVTKVDMK